MNLGNEINVSIDLVHPFQGLNRPKESTQAWKMRQWDVTELKTSRAFIESYNSLSNRAWCLVEMGDNRRGIV